MDGYLKKILLMVLIAGAMSTFSQSVYDAVVTNVRIVDVEDGTMSGPTSIFIQNNRIVGIGLPTSSDNFIGQTIDGKGGYAIPGLWDMHIHPDDPEIWRMGVVAEDQDLLMPQFVLRGVVGVRDMAGRMEIVNRWRQLGQNGELFIPKIIAAGPLLDGPNPMFDGSVAIATTDRASFVADSLMAAGVDFLKVYSLLPQDIFFSLTKHARQKGYPIAGHVPYDVTPTEAAESGMNSHEHLLEILNEASHVQQAREDGKIDLQGKNGYERYLASEDYMFEHIDTAYLRTMIKNFAEFEIYQTPTLTTLQKNIWFEEERIKDDQYWPLLPRYNQAYWTTEHNDHLKYRGAAIIENQKRHYLFKQFLTREMFEFNVPLLVGSDMGANPLCWAGLGVHNEMAEFVKAGVSPLGALQAATINPARYLNLENDYGSIDTGHMANFIVLKSNPLVNIENTRDILGIHFDGQWISEERIGKELKKIKRKLAH